jgi:hypothetical protein
VLVISCTLNSCMSIIQAFGIFMQLAEISKKIYHFIKLFLKESCDANMFTWHTVVLPLVMLSVIFPHAGAITLIVMCDNNRGELNLWSCYSTFKIFHPSVRCVSQEGTHVEPKWKHVSLTLKQKIEILRHWERVEIGFCKNFSQQIHVTSTLHSPYILNNRVYGTVFE